MLKTFNAVYSLTDPHSQIKAYVYDVVRATLPKMDLDQAFEEKESIAAEVKRSLSEVSSTYNGHALINVS